jgi:hypothetical protein
MKVIPLICIAKTKPGTQKALVVTIPTVQGAVVRGQHLYDSQELDLLTTFVVVVVVVLLETL